MKDIVQFETEKRYSAGDKMKLYQKFKKVVGKRDSSLIDNKLYEFLHQYCGYIAHYNLYGFREEYRGLNGMIHMLEQLPRKGGFAKDNAVLLTI